MKARTEVVWFWLFAGPAVAGFLLFAFVPMIWSLYLSLCRYDVIHPPEFIGLSNYFYLLRNDPAFWPSVKVTAVFAVVNVPASLISALAVAILLNQKVFLQGMFRTVFFLPSILPAAASTAVFVFIFDPDNGLLNSLLAKVGIIGPAWLTSSEWALPTLILISLWGFGSAMLIFLGSLQGISQELHEAAAIDGAGTWSRFRNVTLPQISPVIFFNLVMGVIAALKVFDLAFAFGAAQGKEPGGPARATLFYVLNLYDKGFNYFHMGLASAMAWLLFIVVVALTAFNFWAAKKWVHYNN
jgi:multiple sugar transport system permease protein